MREFPIFNSRVIRECRQAKSRSFLRCARRKIWKISGFLTLWALFLTGSLAGVSAVQGAEWSLVSPNDRLRIVVSQRDGFNPPPDSEPPTQLYYRIEAGKEGERSIVLTNSALGMALDGDDLRTGLTFVEASGPFPVDVSYEMPHGKRSACRNHGRGLTLRFRGGSGLGPGLELDLRAFDDGIAFRYRITGSTSRALRAESEATSFTLPVDSRIWAQPADRVTAYSPAYETYYQNGIRPGTPSETGMGWSFPFLFKTGSYWALITEANVGTNYCGSHLTDSREGTEYRIQFPDPAEARGLGEAQPGSTLPWEMPWRIVILGDSPGTLVESTLVTDLCDASRVQETDWIRPGRVAWSWWSDPPSPQDAIKQKHFVDLAAEMGWEYILVDANWTIMDKGTIHDVIRYAQEKKVGVLLWYNSGGPHNVVTEKPRDSFTYEPVRRFEFDMLRRWGVKGVKIDFFQSDKQELMRLYHEILKDAADYKIMVNFHGCTLPRGWSRTWPHLMSMEAIRGEECYIFDPQFPERAPIQNTITPFTRNVVGPADYTPVGLTDNSHPHRTTYSHELALSVLFETGWLHFADKPEAYMRLPAEPRDFLKKVPVAWDDTRWVTGYPGQYVVIARRKGDTWFLAGINGGSEARQENLRLGSWAGMETWQVELIHEGKDGRNFATEKLTLRADQPWPVTFRPYGGFVATLRKTDAP